MKAKVYLTDKENGKYLEQIETLEAPFYPSEVIEDTSLKYTDSEASMLNVHTDVEYQEVLGVGGAFTETSAINYKNMPDEKKNEGREQSGKEGKDRCNRHRKALGAFLGDRLRQNFTEGKNCQRHHDRRHERSRVLITIHQIDEQNGGKRGRGDIDDVVADQNSGKQLVVVVGQTEHALRLLFAVLRHALHAGTAKGSKCGLGCREKGAETEKNHQYGDKYGYTVQDKISSKNMIAVTGFCRKSAEITYAYAVRGHGGSLSSAHFHKAASQSRLPCGRGCSYHKLEEA